MKKLLTAQDWSLKLRFGMVQCYVFPILLYGVEGWTLNKELIKRFKALMWVYRDVEDLQDGSNY